MSGWRNGWTYKKAFFALSETSKSANFNKRIETIATLILRIYVYNVLKGQSMLYPDTLYIFQCENIVSSFISVRRLAMPDIDEQDKSHTFFL